MAIQKASGSTYLSLASDTYYCRNRDFTIMAWVRPTEDPGTNGNYQSVIGCWDAGATNGWSLAWNGDLVFNFGWAVSGSYSSYPVTGTALSLSTWYHVAVSYNAAGGIWEMFVNGVQTRLVDETSTIPSVTATMRIGQDPDNPTGMAGSLAYVRVFEGYLSQAEVQAEMRSAIPVNRRCPCSLDIPLENLGTSTVVGPDRSYTGHHVQSVTGTVSWGAGPPAVSSLTEPVTRRRRIEQLVKAGGVTVSVGQASETDTATAVGRAKARSTGQATETDTATAVSRSKSRATGAATETDTATAITRTKRVTLGQAAETDTARPVTRGGQAIAVGQATETGTAQAVSRAKAVTTGRAAETDTSQPVTRVKTKTLGQATETDTATAVARTKRRTTGQAVETDLAQPVTKSGSLIVAVGQAVETSSAQPVTRTKRMTIGLTIETSLSRPISRAKSKGIGFASDTNTAIAIGRRKALTLGLCTETSLATSVGRSKSRTLAVATETSSALQITRTKRRAVAVAAEADLALAVTNNLAQQRDIVLAVGAAQGFWSVGQAGALWSIGTPEGLWQAGKAGAT